MFKVIVAGSREFCDYDFLRKKLEKLFSGKKNDEIEIVSGGAKGADSLGERFARENGCKLIIFKSNWDKYGRKAGPIRNIEMGKYADALVAFWDGESTGTAHMIDFARKNNLDIRVILFNGGRHIKLNDFS